ncbi:MAG: hypothetical protein [Bacteriophage sp.]|nr:MAG: hypothetical protein [Bacteriophage sp.]
MREFSLTYKSKINYLRNKRIQEYDMKSGGYSLTISENLIDNEDLIKKLKISNKVDRQIILGLHSRENKEFVKALNEAFKKYLNAFIHLNNISENRILFTKKDSITLFDSNVTRTKFKKVEYTKRGEYTSFLQIGKLEFYINSNTKQNLLKGITLKSYKDTLVEEIFKLMYIAEFSPKRNIEAKLAEIRDAYVNRELEDTYYKELSVHNKYLLKNSLLNNTVYSDLPLSEDDEFFDDIDISYNYINILLPLFKIFI